MKANIRILDGEKTYKQLTAIYVNVHQRTFEVASSCSNCNMGPCYCHCPMQSEKAHLGASIQAEHQ